MPIPSPAEAIPEAVPRLVSNQSGTVAKLTTKSPPIPTALRTPKATREFEVRPRRRGPDEARHEQQRQGCRDDPLAVPIDGPARTDADSVDQRRLETEHRRQHGSRDGELFYEHVVEDAERVAGSVDRRRAQQCGDDDDPAIVDPFGEYAAGIGNHLHWSGTTLSTT